MRLPFSSLVRSVGVFLLGAGLCGTLSAATVSKLNDDVLSPLRDNVGAKQIHLGSVPLYAHGTANIDLEEFQVWAPDGKVIVDDGKSVTYLDPPPMRFFRGLVNGDPESFAYFSVDGTTGAIYGLIATRDGKFSVGASRRKPFTRGHGQTGDDFDYFLAASDESDEIPMTGQTWECENEKLPPISQINRRMLVQTDASGHQVIAQGISGTQAYAIAVEVETDDELYANAGSPPLPYTALTNYITNLTGAVSTIYNRDIHTNVVQQNLHLHTGGPGTDPWTAATASAGLNELGDYYHANNLSLKRSAVIMLSGKTTNSGVAWEGVVGGGDFSNGGDFGGGYAWCGSIGDFGGVGLGSVPDPNATTNGTLYGMPTGGNNYWPLEEYAHELGHNLAGHHTHCVAITDAERTAAGFTDGSPSNSTSNFVDHCYGAAASGGEVGCYSGTNYVAGSQGTYKGTIMSYCHNVFLSGVPQSRFTFGQASPEPSHHELDDYLLNAGGPGANGGNYNIVTAVGTFSMTGPTGASSVAANSTGNTVSVSTSNGATVTYLWTITGGTITAGATSATVTYTAGASGSVVLRATTYNTPAGNNFSGFPWNTTGVTDNKTVSITSVSPPTNVVATALTSTSVQITWTAAAGATKYEISRSATGSNSGFTAVCIVASTCPTSSPFTDSTASANTAYIYKVKSVDAGSNLSVFSNGDLATTVIFTDSLVQNTTKVKLVHMNELRTAMTAVCTLAANPSPCSTAFTDPSLTTSTKVKVLHLTELRAKLNASRTALGLTAQSYAEGSITTATTIKAAQINELRNGVQ